MKKGHRVTGAPRRKNTTQRPRAKEGGREEEEKRSEISASQWKAA
jgi:hypothetical protein